MINDDYHDTCASEAEHERWLENRARDFMALQALVKKGDHDGKCENCDCRLWEENTVDSRYGFYCDPCADDDPGINYDNEYDEEAIEYYWENHIEEPDDESRDYWGDFEEDTEADNIEEYIDAMAIIEDENN